MNNGLIPAFTRNSARTDSSFVCPDLRSSPPMKDFSRLASSMTPGTSIFWGGTVHERLALEDGSDGEEGQRRRLGLRGADGSKKAVSRVVHARDDVTVTLGVGSPEHDDRVRLVLSLEATDVGADVLENQYPGQRVGAGLLVGGDEVGIVD